MVEGVPGEHKAMFALDIPLKDLGPLSMLELVALGASLVNEFVRQQKVALFGFSYYREAGSELLSRQRHYNFLCAVETVFSWCRRLWEAPTSMGFTPIDVGHHLQTVQLREVRYIV